MAIIKLTDSRYTGLSRDIKPREAKLGASFYEYDTELIYDKTLNINSNNGWKLRSNQGGGNGGDSDTSKSLKGKITSKNKNGVDYLVIMAGEDDVNFQEGDVVIAEVENGRTIVAKVGPVFNTIADLRVMIDGRIFIP